jgi:hypothetical protein
LGLVDFDISVTTIDHAYQFGVRDHVVILNEFDILFDEKPYMIYNNSLSGVW